MRKLTLLSMTLGALVSGCGVEPARDEDPPAGMTRPDPRPEDVTVEMIQQKVVTCVKTSFPSGACTQYKWTVSPNGFASCAGDNSTYEGEITFFKTVNWVEYCIWAHPAPGATINTPTMNDWDPPSPLQTFQLRSRLAGGGVVFQSPNFGGGFFTWLGPRNGGPAVTSRDLSWVVRSGSFTN